MPNACASAPYRYNCVDTLFKAIVLKKKVDPVNYMPIELLSKENIDFYRRTQL